MGDYGWLETGKHTLKMGQTGMQKNWLCCQEAYGNVNGAMRKNWNSQKYSMCH